MLFAPAVVAALLVRLVGAGPFCVRELRSGANGAPFSLCVAAPTPAGRLLVRMGLGRLPALWNVLSGELWLVGPRPLPPVEHQRLLRRRPFGELRPCVRPGWVGWADLAPGRAADPLRDFDYDLYYIRRRSLRFDARVLWRAAGNFLSGGEPR